MSSTAQTSRPRKTRRWLKWVTASLLFIGVAVGSLYAYLFVHIVPPRSIEVVDATTHQPLPNINVCMQAIATGLGHKQALRSETLTTDANGKVLFWPSIHNMALLQTWYGYSIQVTDPRSNFTPPCGPDVGLEFEHLADQLVDRRLDESAYLPVELVEHLAPSWLMDVGWIGIRRSNSFRWSMQVELVPILRTLDDCKRIGEAHLVEDCRQLNMKATADLQQELLPRFFAGMQRKDVLSTDDDSRASDRRGYLTAYERPTVPAIYTPIVVMVEQFADARNAIDHFSDISRAIPGYDPATVSEDEPIPGQKIKRIVTPANSRAFWISGKRLILITFLRPSVFDQTFVIQWLVRDPSTLKSPTS